MLKQKIKAQFIYYNKVLLFSWFDHFQRLGQKMWKFSLVFWGMRRRNDLLLIFTDLYQSIVCFYSISDKYLCGDARNNNAKSFGRKKKHWGEIKTGCFYEVSISVRNNCPLGPSHEEDMYFGRLMVICGLCYCKLECLCCSMFLQDGPQKFWLQHTHILKP